MSETDKTLNDILSYLRITAAATSKSIAAKVLDTKEKALVYSKMDGMTPQKKIESITGVPDSTIFDWFKIFVEAGLAAPPNKYYPSSRALFSLNELGINVSSLKKGAKSGQAEKSSTTLDAAISDDAKKEVK